MRDGRYWESEHLTEEQREEFLRYIDAYESAPLTTHYEQLTRAGVELPAPDTLDDEAVSAKVWEVLKALADLNAFVTQTNHLSDRELYSVLWNDVLRQEFPDVEDDSGEWHIDLVSSGSDEDTALYFTYYADDDEREDWLREFPDYVMPPRAVAPFDRDRRLTALYDGEPS